MARLRKHLQNKKTSTAPEEGKKSGSPTRTRGARIRKRIAEEGKSTTAQPASTGNATAPSLRKKTANDSKDTNARVAPKVRKAKSTQGAEEAKPAPRIHAAPPRVHAAPQQLETEPVDEHSSAPEDSTLGQEHHDVSNDTNSDTGSVAEQQSAEQQSPEQTGHADSEATLSAETAQKSSEPVNLRMRKKSSVSSTKKAEDSDSKSKTGPTVHAAPPEAYLRAQRAIAQLGSAVVSPPPANTGTSGAGTAKKNKWEESPADSKEKERGKSLKDKKTNRRRNRRWSSVDSDNESSYSSPRRRMRRKKGVVKASPKAKAIKRRVMIDGTITVADLAHAMSQKSGVVIKTLIGFGEMATINDTLDFETASTIAAEFDFEAIDTSFQEDQFLITEEKKEEGELRAPVVTIMGHVDHGKTTLLDTIRNANVADGEAGGITQHTSAYQVEHEGQLITFIDTPGHEAFTAMRARGAQVTDIVILVVAADDGPMPQTIEALNHARASGVQLMVAVNKCDKPGANPDKVRQDMMRYELVSEEYGGDTIFVNVSALKGEGIDELLENITLLSEMGEYRAPVKRHAEGFVLEARLEKGRGAVATLLVKSGTLKKGDTLVLGNVWGRVRALYDYNGKSIKEALPSSPVELIGLQEIPTAGDDFVVVKKPKDAKALVAHRAEEAKNKAMAASSKPMSLEELLRRQVEGEPVKLNLIIKSDVGGTLEAMKGSIAQIEVPGTEVNILHAAIGGITESDVSLAHTYDGIIIGFNVRPDAKARKVVNQTNVEVRTYSIIYEALEDLEKGLKGLLEPEIKEQWKGSAEIRETFSVPKVGTVAGCFVLDGSIARKHRIRLLRDGTIMWEGKLASLRRFKDDVREVEKGYECGMNLDGFNDIKVGDQLEAFMMEEEERE